MGNSKIVFGDRTLIDLSGDTVTPQDLRVGVTAHNAAGEQIVGTNPGGSSGPVGEGDINFYDYDGTLLHAWTLAELAGKTALPELPTQPGLICQGWNWSLAALKATNRKMNVGATYITDDGKTRIYIHLEEGRTSPMLGVCPNGTVTVDWGDGTTPDTLTGTSTSTVQWTPTHNYAAPGDYVIKLTVSGEMAFYGYAYGGQYSGVLRYSSGSDSRNVVYQNSVRKIEIGNGVTSIGANAFTLCYSLVSITIPVGVINIGNYALQNCASLAFVTVPNGVSVISDYTASGCSHLVSIAIPDGVTSIGNYAFSNCYSLVSVTIPDSVTSIGGSAFNACYALASITIPDGVTSLENGVFYYCKSLTSIAIPDSVTMIGVNAFRACLALASITIPDGVTSIGAAAFQGCSALASITIPSSVTSIGTSAFQECSALASITTLGSVTSIESKTFQNSKHVTSITIPDSVTSIGVSAFQGCPSFAFIAIPPGVAKIFGSAFSSCAGVRFYDFSRHAAVPNLASTNAFSSIPADCVIRVPAALVDEWKAATNWATYADHIVGVAA